MGGRAVKAVPRPLPSGRFVWNFPGIRFFRRGRDGQPGPLRSPMQGRWQRWPAEPEQEFAAHHLANMLFTNMRVLGQIILDYFDGDETPEDKRLYRTY
ncbi:hypothetical protein Memar_1762 [Methanoculleus marisnigri JR1]|uniref:Uncharacterized protein n=1 Tax=Methanoculleus marisnigri (strain ATCC 35101 / DSM 1498 / JR1) TaxID=368407 RepID=A3CWD8_METMJ|nr:hypothetical protein Memar_1762 [Methanoculleus marisnigri JR1]